MIRFFKQLDWFWYHQLPRESVAIERLSGGLHFYILLYYTHISYDYGFSIFDDTLILQLNLALILIFFSSLWAIYIYRKL